MEQTPVFREAGITRAFRTAASSLQTHPRPGPPNIGLALGWLTGTGSISLDASLALAEEDGRVSIISAPKVLTVNGGKATISRGEVQYFEVRTQDTVDYKEIPAVLSLDVTPTISADNHHVTMLVEITDDRPLPASRTVDTLGNETESPPGRTEKKVITTLMVKTGDTVVIGGIYFKRKQVVDSGVPWVMDIPLLGWLFKAEYEEREKSELLIFLTPTVVDTLIAGDDR